MAEFILTNKETGKSVILEDHEVDAVFDSMSEYQYHGEEETVVSKDIQVKIWSICSE